MRHALPLTLALAGLLSACGDDQTVQIPASWSPTNTLTYAYPYNGQTQIAPTAPIVLHFANKLTESDAAAVAAHFKLSGDTNGDGNSDDNPTLTATLTDGNRGVLLTPGSKLVENASYSLSWQNLPSADGNIKPVPISFMTRPANKGARKLMTSGSGAFTVARTLPVQSTFPMMDFSSLRVQFTEPLDQKSLKYGDTVSLVDASDAVVPARVLASNRLLTIDPVNDLTPGQKYTLKISTGLKSSLGDAFAADYAQSFTPLDSKPRATMALEVPDSSGGVTKSPLTGAAINNVPIASTLLGSESASQQKGNLYAELAFVPNYPKATPLRVPRGNVLTGSSVDVKIVGKIPAGLNTGAIRVDIISDANGYMVDNPYSNAIDAPKQVYLTMDVAMSAADSPSNGAFNQNILHVDVVGTAIVKNAKLVMDAVGVVELDVLGLDLASGVLSFHLEGYQDQPNAPKPVADKTAPALQSANPVNAAGSGKADRARPGDPVILNFTEPLDPASISSSSLKFLKGGVDEPFTWRHDGSSLVIQPTTPLTYGATYNVQLTTDAKDLAGNPFAAAVNTAFTLPTQPSPGSRSPVVLAAYPGFPCATSGGSLTVSGGVPTGTQGRCIGGKNTDDVLPLTTLPSDRAIQVQFSQSMNSSSLNSTTVKVESSSNGSSWSPVAGRIEVSAQSLRFYPDTPWAINGLYRYTLSSNGSLSSSSCNPASAICGSNGLPLQTQLIAQTVSGAPAATGGGPNMSIAFKGVAPSTTTLQRLRGLPSSDINANFVHDAGEADATGSGSDYSAVNGARIVAESWSGLVSAAKVGCASGACPLNEFLFLSSTLDAEVADYHDITAGESAPFENLPQGASVRVLIQPTQLVASSVDVYATSLGQTIVAATGPQVMRVRYAPDSTGARTQPIVGYITSDGSKLTLHAQLELYLDEATLDPKLLGISIGHNLHSYLITAQASGPVTFLEDGRMLATLSNENNVPINVSLNFPIIPPLLVIPGLGGINLVIPKGTLIMEGVSGAIKQ